MTQAPPFTHLLSPVRIGRLEVRNRVVMSPMEVDYGSPEGHVTPRAVAYYRARGEGGVGLVIVEATCVESRAGRLSPRQLVCDRDAAVPGLRRLAGAVRRTGAAVALQLNHAGRKATSRLTGVPPVAPSPLPNRWGETPRELGHGEIAELAERYGEAAARAMLAGFDAVELHAAHGYLISQFLSPTYNRRQDGYGGPLANRCRFLLEVIAQVRRRVGPDFPVLCRLSAVEYEARDALEPLAGGITLEETLEVARRAEAAGIDAFDISATLVGEARLHPMSWPEGVLIPLAAAVKGAVSVPVIATGRIPPRLGEEALAAGRADLVALGRALLADPELVAKLAANRPAEVTPCIYCSLCLDPEVSAEGSRCAVNPALGQEGEMALEPSPEPSKVVVVGGGPGGLEAARRAREAGHQVVLFEEREALGGQLLIRSKEGLAQRTLDDLRRHLVAEVDRLGVEVRLGERFTPGHLARLAPDAVVLATGVEFAPPDIPGAVGLPALPALDVLAGAATGPRVVVVGGELVGCETALALAGQGRQVTLLVRAPRPADRVPRAVALALRQALERAGIEILCRVRVEVVDGAGVHLVTRRGEARTVAADSVVLATGARPRRGLAEALAGRVPQLLEVGDCRRPGGVLAALADGRRAALEIGAVRCVS